MNAIATANPPFIFVVPIPESIREQALAWFRAHSNLSGMALNGDEAKFAEAQWADHFAEDMGNLNV